MNIKKYLVMYLEVWPLRSTKKPSFLIGEGGVM